MAILAKRRHRTAVVCAYFGSWPRWVSAFFHTCGCNEDFDWLIVTDCPVPSLHRPNMTFRPMSLKSFNEHVGARLDFAVDKSAYAQLDFRPAYGVIFAEELAEYDFWGHCDLDVIFGDLGAHFSAARLTSFDILSSRKNCLAGHLTLWRNDRDINQLFMAVPNYKALLASPGHQNFDEKIMSAFLLERENRPGPEKFPRVDWSQRIVVGWPELERNRRKTWLWRAGKIYDSSGREQVYLHFRSWKRTMKCTDFNGDDKPREFHISRRGMWVAKRPWQDHILCLSPLDLYFYRALSLSGKLLNRLGGSVS